VGNFYLPELKSALAGKPEGVGMMMVQIEEPNGTHIG
jgi:hypothetical protein